MKDHVVVFTKTNARILVNPPNMAELLMNNQAVLNPSMEYVKSTPPHFWKYDGGFIVPMNPEEMKLRLELIKQVGVDNSIINVNQSNLEPSPNFSAIIGELENKILEMSQEIKKTTQDRDHYKIQSEHQLSTLRTYSKRIHELEAQISDADEACASGMNELIKNKKLLRSLSIYFSVVIMILSVLLWCK